MSARLLISYRLVYRLKICIHVSERGQDLSSEDEPISGVVIGRAIRVAVVIAPVGVGVVISVIVGTIRSIVACIIVITLTTSLAADQTSSRRTAPTCEFVPLDVTS